MLLEYEAPKKVRYKGVEYKVHNHPLNVLHTIQLLEEEENEVERAIILIHKMFGVEAPIEEVLLNEALLILNNGKELEGETQVDKPLIGLIDDFSTYKLDFDMLFKQDIKNDKNLTWSDFLNKISYIANNENTGLFTLAKVRSTDPKDVDKKHRRKFVEYQKSIEIQSKEEEKITDVDSYWGKQLAKAKGQFIEKEKEQNNL